MANTAIGIAQERRAKRALDRLAALMALTARAVQSGCVGEVPLAEVVVGDLVRLAPGDQVVADGTLKAADGLALDESVLTGESEAVARSTHADRAEGIRLGWRGLPAASPSDPRDRLTLVPSL